MRFLRQSTASQEILLGPFVAAADGTAQTGLTIANTDIKLLVGGATSEANKNSGGGTHIAGGRYSAVLDATDTATVGILEVSVAPASGIPWNKSYYVLEEAVYDALFAASALGYVANAPVNVAQWLGSAAATPTVAGVPEVDVTHWIGTAAATPTTAGVPEVDLTFIAGAAVSTTTAQLGVNAVQISGDGTAADNLETAFDDTTGAVPWQGVARQGTAQSATGTTLVLDSSAPFADDTAIGMTLWAFGSTQGYWQSRLITDYVNSTDTATVEAWTVTPSGTITYKVALTAPGTSGSGLDAAGVRAAIGMASANLDTQLSTIDNLIDTEVADIQARLPAALVSGRMDASVGAMAANVITAAATAADFTTEVTASVATASALATLQTSVNTVDDLLDTEIAALTTAVADLPTNAELATALGTADDAVLTQIALVKTQTDKFANLPVLTAGGTGGQGYGAP